MSYLLAPIFGNGQDGDVVVNSNTTQALIESYFRGNAGSLTGTAMNSFFAPGQAVLIHQSQLTNTGQWERNVIKSYTNDGTITFSNPLSYTYSFGAQILVLRQYRSVRIDNFSTLSPKPWDGVTGGILAFLCNGTLTVNGSLSASGRGYRGGAKGNNGINQIPAGQAGEGYLGTGSATFDTNCYLANGNGGGGGVNGSNPQNAGSGGGGGHNGSGVAGQIASGAVNGAGGEAAGLPDLSLLFFGGSGGGGQGNNYDGGNGGNGGGIILIYSRNIRVNGGIVSNGATANIGNAGGGAGGSILLIGQHLTLGTGLVSAEGGYGSTQQFPNGGNGAPGRVALARCSVTGSTFPPHTDRGYQTYCGIIGRG